MEPLVQLMKNFIILPTDPSATDDETSMILGRRAEQIIQSASIPTLHKAIITADELMKFWEDRPTRTDANRLDSPGLEDFLKRSRARARATEAILWMAINLPLGHAALPSLQSWSPTEHESPSPERRRTPAAEPIMLRAIEDALQRGAEESDYRWLSWLATHLQTASGLSLSLILRGSVPVEQHDN